MLCNNKGNCSHTGSAGEYVCNCHVGYTGINCDIDINECDAEPCHNNGTCIVRTLRQRERNAVTNK